LKKWNFDMSPMEFRDALAIRYRKPAFNLPSTCDGCGEPFNIDHALCCRRGGLIIRRHNEVRGVLGDMMETTWGCCIREPIIKEQNPMTNQISLKGDLACRGVWEPQVEALFDIRIVDADAPSYSSMTLQSVLRKSEKEKKTKYTPACEERHATFTPLVTTTDGFFGAEFNNF
jgi:hypothetical protein